MKTYYTYILECSDGTFYVGMTNDLIKRFHQHQTGYNPNAYTYKRRPVALVYFVEYNQVLDAIAREKQLKGWSAQKKRALTLDEIDLLKKLSECRNETHHLLRDKEE
jgi:putative endonuclease